MSQGDGGTRYLTDPDTHAEIVPSYSRETIDGYRYGEPKWLRCPECGARVKITRDPTDPGWDELPHKTNCEYRGVKFRWWWEQFGERGD